MIVTFNIRAKGSILSHRFGYLSETSHYSVNYTLLTLIFFRIKFPMNNSGGNQKYSFLFGLLLHPSYVNRTFLLGSKIVIDFNVIKTVF